MAEAKRITVAALNIVASPHPPDIYATLLKVAAEIEVPVWGNDWAFITPPQRLRVPRQNWLHGRILLWTRIRKDQPWINKKKRDQATREESKKASAAVPDDFEPNYRSFHYVLVEDKHRLVFEARNELGEKFGPIRAEAFFSRLLSADHLPATAPKANVEVTVMPEDDALETILKLPTLRRLEILVKRPNPDYNEQEFREVMRDLEEQGAGSRRTELVRAPGTSSLIPNDKTRKLAEVGAANGYVKGEGNDANGRPVIESTKDHPKIRSQSLVGASLEALYASVRFFI